VEIGLVDDRQTAKSHRIPLVKNMNLLMDRLITAIMLGSYLVYSNNSDSNRTAATPIAAAEHTAAPMAPAPPAS
jgi:hypothetical protein